MNDITKFMLSQTQYLKINLEPIGKDDCEVCTHCDIDYIDKEKNICIRFGYEYISTFYYTIVKSGYIQKLIKNKMVLDENLVNDLGFKWNQYFERIIKNTDIDTYLFWSNSHKQIRPYYDSWMYNDENGNIIFEITPFYPWFGKTKKTHPEKIPYKEWIKDYKPTVKTIIPKKNLKQWIKQAQKLAEKYDLKF